MLTTLYPLLNARNPKFINNWKRCINENKMIFDYNMNRYKEVPFTLNEITKRLKAIALYIDINYTNTLNGDIDIYLSYIEPLRFKIESYIRSTFPNGTNGPWVRNNGVYECIIPIQTVRPLEQLPIDLDYDYWKDIKPVRIISHDSKECVYNVTNVLKFDVFKPSVFIFSLDIDIFILKYLKWTKTIKNPNDIAIYIDSYIYNDVFLPLMNDLFNIWIFNIVDECASAVDKTDVNNIIQFQSYKIKPPSTLTGLQHLYDFFQDARNSNIQFEDVLATNLFDGKNIVELIEFSIKNIRTYNMFQYNHHELLLEMRLIHLLFKLRKLDKNEFGKKPMDVVFDRYIDKYVSNKITNQFRHPVLRNYIEERLFEMTRK